MDRVSASQDVHKHHKKKKKRHVSDVDLSPDKVYGGAQLDSSFSSNFFSPPTTSLKELKRQRLLQASVENLSIDGQGKKHKHKRKDTPEEEELVSVPSSQECGSLDSSFFSSPTTPSKKMKMKEHDMPEVDLSHKRKKKKKDKHHKGKGDSEETVGRSEEMGSSSSSNLFSSPTASLKELKRQKLLQASPSSTDLRNSGQEKKHKNQRKGIPGGGEEEEDEEEEEELEKVPSDLLSSPATPSKTLKTKEQGMPEIVLNDKRKKKKKDKHKKGKEDSEETVDGNQEMICPSAQELLEKAEVPKKKKKKKKINKECELEVPPHQNLFEEVNDVEEQVISPKHKKKRKNVGEGDDIMRQDTSMLSIGEQTVKTVDGKTPTREGVNRDHDMLQDTTILLEESLGKAAEKRLGVEGRTVDNGNNPMDDDDSEEYHDLTSNSDEITLDMLKDTSTVSINELADKIAGNHWQNRSLTPTPRKNQNRAQVDVSVDIGPSTSKATPRKSRPTTSKVTQRKNGTSVSKATPKKSRPSTSKATQRKNGTSVSEATPRKSQPSTSMATPRKRIGAGSVDATKSSNLEDNPDSFSESSERDFDYSDNPEVKAWLNKLELELIEENLDFDPPELHRRHSHLSGVTAKEKEEFKEAGIKFRLGKWDRNEDAILRENMENFVKKYKIPSIPLILGINRWSKKEKVPAKVTKFLHCKKFLFQLGKGLNLRSLFSVYLRARKTFDPMDKSRLSPEELKLMFRLQTKVGNKWNTISEIMNKPSAVLFEASRYHKEKKEIGVWSAEENEKLVKAVRKKLKLKSDGSCRKLPWNAIAQKVGTRNSSQCRKQWLEKLCWQFTHGLAPKPRWSDEDSLRLIQHLYESDVQTEADIDWDHIFTKFSKHPADTAEKVRGEAEKKGRRKQDGEEKGQEAETQEEKCLQAKGNGRKRTTGGWRGDPGERRGDPGERRGGPDERRGDPGERRKAR